MSLDAGAALEDWAGYYTLMGGAAATLLGLLFVSVSLRLNIFRQDNVADVRDFAALTFCTFLSAIAIAGLSLAPHERPEPLAMALVLGFLVGCIGIAWIIREWRRLSQVPASQQLGGPLIYEAYVVMTLLFLSYFPLLIAAILIWQGNVAAFGVLALAEAGMIGSGTLGAWLLLAHAGTPNEPGERT
jgi:hypothetical protein